METCLLCACVCVCVCWVVNNRFSSHWLRYTKLPINGCLTKHNIFDTKKHTDYQKMSGEHSFKSYPDKTWKQHRTVWFDVIKMIRDRSDPDQLVGVDQGRSVGRGFLMSFRNNTLVTLMLLSVTSKDTQFLVISMLVIHHQHTYYTKNLSLQDEGDSGYFTTKITVWFIAHKITLTPPTYYQKKNEYFAETVVNKEIKF